MKLLGKIILMAVSLLPIYSHATTTICTVEQDAYDLLGIETVVWDDQKKTATISGGINKNQKGIVTAVRKHGNGEKVNIFIKYTVPNGISDAAELMIFPMNEDEFRVIGVTYNYKNGNRLLDLFTGNQTAKCKSL